MGNSQKLEKFELNLNGTVHVFVGTKQAEEGKQENKRNRIE